MDTQADEEGGGESSGENSVAAISLWPMVRCQAESLQSSRDRRQREVVIVAHGGAYAGAGNWS